MQREREIRLLTKKKNEDGEAIETRSSIPVFVDASDHIFTVKVMDIFLDAHGEETRREVRESYDAEYGEQVEAHAFDYDRYCLVSDAMYRITVEQDTDIKFFYEPDGSWDNSEDKDKTDDSEDEKEGGTKKEREEEKEDPDTGETHDTGDSSADGTGDTGFQKDKAKDKGDAVPNESVNESVVNNSKENPAYSDQDEETSVVSYGKYAKDIEDIKETKMTGPAMESLEQGDKDPEKADDRRYRIMATGIITSMVAVGMVATGAFKYLWMLLLTLFTRKRRHKWHGIFSDRKNRFVKVRDVSRLGMLYQDYIDEYKEPGAILDELVKSRDSTLLPVNTKAEITYGNENISVPASEEEVFRIIGNIPKGTGNVNVRIHNDMAGFEMPLVFKI